MQVKKFEARSMKEALEMIKTQLGPDAIILSAKEITKGFGLGGEKSIEVTAAYSETILRKKQFVESKMPDMHKEKFQRIPAKDQKEVMRKMIESQLAKMPAATPATPPPKLTSKTTPYRLTEKRYIEIDDDHIGGQEKTAVTQVAKKAWNDMEVTSLKQEIETLKQVMSQFKTMPQSFVQAHPGADYGVHYQMSAHYQKLTSCGLLPEVAGNVVSQCQKQLSAQQQGNKATVESWMAKYILDTTPVTSGQGEQFHLFMGPSGSGKTSALIKLASDMILNQKKRVAIISTDSTKVGAAEQMKIFAQILNVPFLSVRSQQDWSHVIPHLEQLDHVLVDFSGLNMRNQEEVNYVKRIGPPVFHSLRTHLVLSATAKDADLLECAKRYEAVGFDDVIFNDLDEAAQHGNIYNFIRKVNTELFAFGIGPKVPEDFEYATPERVVDLLLKITQNRKQEVSL
ncbi:flagellar biosynthesis protein FlhF [Pseudobdellovibrio exovorus]|uniref:Flagellar biosynthesis protein FlhF n=1 Tax=Pseudobdellovibrio exovorus JSS TaxID=1184267 RepID=M4V8P7_9BACT|nr:flagellar biosynthesis protein FlhF [Pseudobdellovibrio exovorus]AGH94835.1 flagellar biosynthesis protein [Pseudobdellovibrio exovorus JSS]